MPDRPKLTPARRHALTVLLAGEKAGVGVRVSNRTGTPTLRYSFHTVSWQVGEWLIANGYATSRRNLGADVLTLTATGRQLAEEAGDGDLLVVPVYDWPNNPRLSPIAVRVNECAVNAVARAEHWWAEWRYFNNEARICTEVASLAGDLVHVHCENREHADWLHGLLLDRGIHKTALKVIRTNCTAEPARG